jgi:sortase A
VSQVTDQLAVDGPTDASGADAPDDSPAAPTGADADAVESGRRQRISKWDRPPQPHDWRFYVGSTGKVLIATGILMFGFVAYQLWGTGIETARAQNKLENQFEELLLEFGSDDDDAAAPAATVIVSDDDATPDRTPSVADLPDGRDSTDSADAAPDDAVATPDDPSPSSDSDSDADAIAVAVDPSEAAVEQKIPPIVRGDVLARLEIPKIDRVDYVVPGVTLNDLKKGPGHYPDTPLPGQLGNASIAGHRTTYGAPFFDVDQLEPNDELIVTMANGDRFVYEVTSVEIVAASDYWVVTTTDPDIAELTLTSCHPKYTARDRIVVRSVLNPAKSSDVGIPTYYELEPDPDAAPIPGDDPTLQADETVDEPIDDATESDRDTIAVAPADGDDAATGPAADDEAVVAVADPVRDEAEPADEGTTIGSGDDDRGVPLRSQPVGQAEDAFSQGWFHDMSAFPQIALWGTALTIISLAAYAISRRFRHDSIGFLVGIGPFLFALYFFFQNVNRLLPPGL